MHNLGVRTDRETGLHHHGRIVHLADHVVVASRSGDYASCCRSAAHRRSAMHTLDITLRRKASALVAAVATAAFLGL